MVIWKNKFIRASDKQVWKAVTKEDSQHFQLSPASRTRALRIRGNHFVPPKIKTEFFKNVFINRWFSNFKQFDFLNSTHNVGLRYLI